MADTGILFRRSARWLWLALALLILGGLVLWVGRDAVREPTEDELRSAMPAMADSAPEVAAPE